ncbi:MAG: DUF937 domain-containing protein [Rubrivivax sp.]|uniref:DUF937 domain-containing protein n=1 Tax=Ottowia sp. TaxID=1898956 RepID=UPI00217853FA|nr:DUF937 domain-containing protein [Ottowia sp.]MCC6812487.1 DUF937 domain-containing protein [Rubrivivax sp.]MCZ2088686.1 DUF937 domain-containing protein [Burkholderiales bacterium]HNR83401.1 DUF937 domain-containing protein [Ottowia sp.]HNT85121.1 DUF937 domain-containing protein [Ottowia sp.]HOZ94541.1 DUF937 domain-containing protein [Ottowia sp.]
MNGSLIDDLMGQLQGPSLGPIAQQLGTDADTAGQAIAAALPMLVGALGRNAQQPGGAGALFEALQRDHAGSGAMDLGGLLGGLLGGAGAGAGSAGMGGMGGMGDLLGSVLGGGAPASRQLDAGGILGHILGGAQPRAEAGLSQATGLDMGQAGKLLMMLAPIVMAALARRVNAGQLDAGGLGDVLGQERAQLQQQGGLGGGLMNAVLDQNGDGQLDLGDLLKLGGSLLGGRR